MGLLILLIGVNFSFLFVLWLVYMVIGRRRGRIYLLIDHLATLARNGMPIHLGLRMIGRDLGGFFGSRIVRMAQALEEGKTLGQAFDAAPRSFPPLLRGMLTLGEKSGNLAAFLEEMRRSYRRIADLPHHSLYLFIYPLLTSMLVTALLAGLATQIAPKFSIILTQVGLKSSAVDVWWPRVIAANELVLTACVLSTLGFVLGGNSIHFGTSLFSWWKGLLDRLVLAMPVFGAQARDGAVQQFALCVGLFLRSGAPLPESLRAAAGVERNGMLRRRFERLADAVEEGTRLSVAARNEKAFESDLIWFLETGEASGMLSDQLLLAAVHYETKVRVAARLAVRGIGPLFVVLNGVIVGTAFFLLFYPIIEIQRFLSGGGR
jgi:general secretion pathway protein F